MTTYDKLGRNAPKEDPSIIQVGLSFIAAFIFWVWLGLRILQ